MINTSHFKSFHKRIKKADSIKKKIKKANEALKKAYVELRLNNLDFTTTNISEIARLIEITKRIEKIYYQEKWGEKNDKNWAKINCIRQYYMGAY